MGYSEAGRQRRCRIWTYVLLALVVFILAAVVPLAVLLPKKHTAHKSPVSVILPLYVYPLNDSTWQPLHDVIEDYPQLNFTVVINPASGPGTDPYPDDSYAAQISRLNSHSNVKTVGYVSTGYATRNLTEVIADVATYGGWRSKSDNLAMHGIFCDESPHEFSEDAAEYMRNLDRAIKSTVGLRGDRMIVHNPGVVPDAVFDDPNTDATVVFEGNYTLWEVQQSQINQQPTKSCLMMNSLPEMAQSDLKDFVNQLASKAQYLFLTSNTLDYYESFGSDWADFVEAVAAQAPE